MSKRIDEYPVRDVSGSEGILLRRMERAFRAHMAGDDGAPALAALMRAVAEELGDRDRTIAALTARLARLEGDAK